MDSVTTDPPTQMSDDLLRQMLTQFMHFTANNSHHAVKSEKIPDPEIFTSTGDSIEDIHEKLETFVVSLTLKMKLNMDHFPTTDARVAYTFSRTGDRAKGHIVTKVQSNQYTDWTDIITDLRNGFSDPDPEFHAQRQLITLRQRNKSFAEFFTVFNKYALRTGFNDKALKCHLRCALCEELAKQLVTRNLNELTYDTLVTECQLQDNQLRAAISTNTRRHVNKPSPSRYVNNITTPVKVTTVAVTSIVPCVRWLITTLGRCCNRRHEDAAL